MKAVSTTFFILFFFICSSTLAAQQKLTIKGFVKEKQSQQVIEFATVSIMDAETKEMITGTTTDLDGYFELRTASKDIYVEISFIGFTNKRIENIEFNKKVADIGTVFLSTDSELLDEVVVRAEKSTTEFKLDKRVFNVGKDISSTGASALEVLNNVPSVNVNIEGEVSLRGSAGVQILINGKPSVLASEQGNALGTITADMIEKIEVITNPSAKYEAEGTAGILNIVIKKEEREGLNGSISLNTGTPHNHSIGVSLNRRTEKFNLFSQIGVGYRELPRENDNINRNLTTNEAIISDGTEFRNEQFYNINLGTDYHINKYNVVTLSGRFAYEVEDQPSRTNFIQTDENNQPIAEWFRTEVTEATNPKFQYELQYKKDFKDDKEHNLLFSFLGNFFGKDQSSEFENIDVVGAAAGSDQLTRTNFQESKYTIQLDYTKPILDKFTMETGVHYVLNNVSNDFAVLDDFGGEWIENPNLTNIFEYEQNVLGVYATGAYEENGWGLKLGVRAENTDLSTLLINTNETNDQNFTNVFPTVHTSYKFSERVSIQGGYSKRIFRPRLWDLNPFFNIRNNFNIRVGNPNLLPEFTDSYEVTSIYLMGKTTLNLGVYYRFTDDVVERISTFEDNVNTTRPYNIGTRQSVGVELNGKYNPSKKITITGDINYNYFNREGVFEATSFDFNADQWSAKLTTKFKLPADIDIEITGQHRSREKIVQGRVSAMTFADIGIRKKILKGKAIVNLSVRDIFVSRIRESEITQGNAFSYRRSLRGRFITLGFSYGFGKGEAMEYSGRRR